MTPLLLVAIAVVTVAFVVAFIRLLLGPSLPDRVVAMDLMATVGSGGIALYAMVTDQGILLDAVMVLSLIFFLGTIAFAYYLERQGEGS
ncbi:MULTISPECIES: monovalent cation/H+ antiporter complex subunit F [Sorangium]|uniref:Cation:proton antiporter n=1 Tax=Sorangium cellulosum TaxID=56 RepID=A0A4P2QPB1_SORCE|nr:MULTISPECIES: monovalent cation/H+ antiporter complex subunit F [Sorangium]AUX31333.1 cation:proton antiporter [Sorangium cellulosum]WCQ90716.1 Na(+)/H(+) antiporter subunit F [Sorangium sp. Soce836]